MSNSIPTNTVKTNSGDEKAQIYWSVWGNAPVTIPIWFSIAGLIYAVIVLYSGCHGKYHDLTLDKRKDVARSFYQDRLTLLGKEIGRLDSLKPKSAMDSAARKTDLSTDKQMYKETKKALVNLQNFNTDTSLLFYARILSADRGEILNTIQKGGESLLVTLKDTCCSAMDTTVHTKQVTIAINRDNKNGLVDVFDHNSSLGIWFVLSLAQMVLWFLVLPLVVGNVKSVDSIVNEFQFDWPNALKTALIPAIVIGVFTYILYSLLIGDAVIHDSYFLNYFNTRMLFYAIPGYLAAALCFTAYLFVANKLELLNVFAEDEKITLVSDTSLQIKYQNLKSRFDFAFLCSAVILSVFVIWMGILFNSINGLEAVRFYTLVSGRPLVNYDFVYLMGLMHSLLLAIFYIPVRLRFNGLKLTQDKEMMDAQDGSRGAKVLKTLTDIIGSILITASPLLTTLIQKGLAGLFS